jgi:hypothetical protein
VCDYAAVGQRDDIVASAHVRTQGHKCMWGDVCGQVQTNKFIPLTSGERISGRWKLTNFHRVPTQSTKVTYNSHKLNSDL